MIPNNTAAAVKRSSTAGGMPLVEQKVHYTVLVRLPFPRGDFVDPAQVEWDATKDQALWKIISRPMAGAGGRREIDWQELAARFEVGQSFILQQAAWLYERHLQHVRAQMRKVGPASGGANTTGASGSGNVGGVPMKRGGSGGGVGGPRTTSALSMRSGARDSPAPGGRMGAGTPVVGGQLSRTPSTTTITQSRLQQQPQSPRQPLRSSFRSSFPPAPRRASPTLEPTTEASRNQSRTVSPTSMNMSQSDSDSSSTDDGKDNPIRRSQVFRRPPRFMLRPAKPGLPRLDDVDIEYDDTTDYGDRAGDERSDGDEDDEDDDEFLPFAVPTRRRTAPTARHQQGSSAAPRRAQTHHHEQQQQQQQQRSSAAAPSRPPLSSVAAGKQPVRSATMDSSFTSASDAPGSTDGDDGNRPRASSGSAANPTTPKGAFAARRQKRRAGTVTAQYSPSSATSGGGPPSGALSPRHRAELARLSPRRREGSEGTPSMGSSFSDLDDASVTQSALEEQLLSHMQHQGGLSKMSTISQALRSKYLP